MKRLALTICCLVACSLCVAKVALVLRTGTAIQNPETFDTSYSLPTGGTTITVGSDPGDDYDTTELQDAIDAASPGDVIVLRAGDTFTGNFILPDKGVGTDWIYIISSALGSLPEGTRVDTSDLANMPTLSPNNTLLPTLRTQFAAHHYRLSGIHISTSSAVLDLVRTGYGVDEGETEFDIRRAETVEEQPQHITFDRMVIRSTSDANRLRHGIMLNGHYMAVKDSYIINVKDTADAQAIWTFEGDGPYQIVNNFLEATGENYLTGGTDPIVNGDVPSDIEFRGNHAFKRLDWKTNDLWGVKNLFELKNSERVYVSGNIFENNWADAQVGVAILFTVRNQDGTAPWSRLRDINFENNLIDNVHAGFSVTGGDDLQASQQTLRVRIHNNIMVDTRNDYGLQARFIRFSGTYPVFGVTVTNNLFLMLQDSTPYPTNDIYVGTGDVDLDTATIQDNIYVHGDFNTDLYSESAAIDTTKSHNVIIMEDESSRYGTNVSNFATWNPEDLMSDEGVSSVGFEDFPNDYRLSSGSQWKGDASDGGDPGPDHDELDAAISGVAEDDLPENE